ncbi:DCC1-like thiol-disulfide oxidoreductase family protein [Thermus tenuipuniceus]|uniref:DCC1-like thiol-disulfide oxidoreductase family protein n=1 Tax=Thermus tenuipuniceus TaxID=2078690 RepID=UPI000CFA0E69|nr:DCC1-like thiol-disulfide oxidoreductase family protein [Thermus tenuipuniceus]
MRVLIDASCPYCRAFGRTLKALDLGGSLRIEPLQEAQGLDREALLQELHILDGERVHRGYQALLALARRLSLLWPLYPLLLMGLAFGLGPRLYRTLAERRPHA